MDGHIWRTPTRHHCRPPRKYGGHPLDIIAQTPLELSYHGRTVVATVLIQKGAPNKLLLGTDVLADLGFVLTVDTPGGIVDLLIATQPQCGEQNEGPQPPCSAGGPPEMPMQSDSRPADVTQTPRSTSRSDQTPENRMGLPELPTPSDSRTADVTQTPRST